MNFYSHHIGDFNNATRHLTRVERALYRDSIELYYDTELPLQSDFEMLARRVLARDDEEKAALKAVLSEFFTLESDGYHNKRCDEEIAKYHAHIESKAKAGRASAAARQQNSTPVEHVLNECATNQEPITINQEPDKPLLSSSQAKPDPVHRLNGKKTMIAEIASYLNLQAQRNFRIENPNGTPTAGALVIEQRLKEGYTVAQCKDVIGVKSNEWMGDEKMHQFLNPETLFRKKNFTKYLAQAEAEIGGAT